MAARLLIRLCSQFTSTPSLRSQKTQKRSWFGGKDLKTSLMNQLKDTLDGYQLSIEQKTKTKTHHNSRGTRYIFCSPP